MPLAASVRAGSLRSRIEIQEQETIQDSFGGLSQVWNTVLQPSASLNPQEGFEEIVMRFWPTLTETNKRNYRIKYRDRLFLIDKVINNQERNRITTLRCTEYVGVTT